MISIVFSGRNDSYGGDFVGRLQRALNYNLKYLDEYGVDYEMIFVEWNPVDDEDTCYLSELLPDKVRCFIVDPLIHRFISENKYIQFFEFFAKNVGASRSQGEYILFTNAEIMFGKDVLKRMAEGGFTSKGLYRAPRIDIHALDVLEQRGIDLAQLSPDVLNDERAWKISHPIHQPPYTNASGDFTLCHRDVVEEFGGYDESIRFTTTHQDSRFVRRVYSEYKECEVIGRVYHVDHERPGRGGTSPAGINWQYSRSNTYVNGPLWGLRDISEDRVLSPSITLVNLKPELTETAKTRLIPEPSLPAQFS